MYTLATSLITVQRATSLILDSRAPASSLTPDRQPAVASRVLVKVTGPGSGTVPITGTVAGVTDTEVLTWTGTAGSRVSVKTFSAVSGFTSTLTGATAIQAQAVGAGGQPDANALTAIRSSTPASVILKNQPGWRGLAPGHELTADAVVKVGYEEVWAPQRGDLIVVDGTQTYEAISVEVRGGALRPREWIVVVQRREGRV